MKREKEWNLKREKKSETNKEREKRKIEREDIYKCLNVIEHEF